MKMPKTQHKLLQPRTCLQFYINTDTSLDCQGTGDRLTQVSAVDMPVFLGWEEALVELARYQHGVFVTFH